MKALYREYVTTEVPAEVLEKITSTNPVTKAMSDATKTVPGLELGFGMTLFCDDNPSESIRVRVYPNELARKNWRHHFVILDALKGADIPRSDIEAALDKSGLSAHDRADILHDIENVDILERCQLAETAQA